MTDELVTTPPMPWSKRMLNAGEVLQAFMAVEVRLTHDLRASQKMGIVKAEKAITAKLKAAKLQTASARATMWMIYHEEQGK